MVFFCHSDDQESYKQNTLIIINGIDCYETNTTIIMKHMGILNWKKGTLGNQAVTTRDKKIANVNHQLLVHTCCWPKENDQLKFTTKAANLLMWCLKQEIVEDLYPPGEYTGINLQADVNKQSVKLTFL